MTDMDQPEPSDEQYIWLSAGDCERCENMEGRLYPAPPNRPHPNCNCTVELVGWIPGANCQHTEAYIQVEHEGNNHTSGELDDTFEVVFMYRITCPRGEVFEGEISIDRTYRELYDDDYYLVEEAYLEAVQVAEGIALSECERCPPQVVS